MEKNLADGQVLRQAQMSGLVTRAAVEQAPARVAAPIDLTAVLPPTPLALDAALPAASPALPAAPSPAVPKTRGRPSNPMELMAQAVAQKDGNALIRQQERLELEWTKEELRARERREDQELERARQSEEYARREQERKEEYARQDRKAVEEAKQRREDMDFKFKVLELKLLGQQSVPRQSVCPKCHASLAASAKFCSSCGQAQ